MSNCISAWKNHNTKVSFVPDKFGIIKVLCISQFANEKLAIGKDWLSLGSLKPFGYGAWIRDVDFAHSGPQIGDMWYAIDVNSGKLAFWKGLVDSSD